MVPPSPLSHGDKSQPCVSEKSWMADHFQKHKEMRQKQTQEDILFDSRPNRMKVGWVISSGPFKACMAVSVFMSIGVVIIETDQRAAEQQQPAWTKTVLTMLLCLFIVELFLRLYVSGHKFFWSKLNVVDLALVVVDLGSLVFERFVPDLPNVIVIRFFRLIRLARLSSVLMRFRPLYLILQGFFNAMQALFFATVLVFIVLSLWSIIAVEFIHPIAAELAATGGFEDCERCGRAYSSVMQSNVTFLQTIIVGDSWSSVVMPIIDHDWRCAAIFGGAFITVQVGMLNLILAVIVDSAAQARQDDEERMIQEKKKAFKHAKSRFYKLCADLDTDHSGVLSEEELLDGLTNHPEFHKLLTAMDITKREVGVLYKMMDGDKSGEVSYAEFTDTLHRFKTDDLRTHIMFLKHYVLEMTSRFDQELAARLKQMECGNNSCDASVAAMEKTSPAPAASEASSQGGFPRHDLEVAVPGEDLPISPTIDARQREESLQFSIVNGQQRLPAASDRNRTAEVHSLNCNTVVITGGGRNESRNPGHDVETARDEVSSLDTKHRTRCLAFKPQGNDQQQYVVTGQQQFAAISKVVKKEGLFL